MRKTWFAICATAAVLIFGVMLWLSGAKAQAQGQAPPPAVATGAPGGMPALPLVDPMAPKKHVLVLGFTDGWHHGSTTDGEVMIWELGRESGLWDTEIRTDPKWITKSYTGLGDNRNLNWFDAIVAVNTTGTWPLNDQQRKDFISAIHDDGKGFVGVHAALDANHDGVWPEFTEMLGGEFAAHPWVTFAAPVIIEDPTFPAMRHFTATHLTMYDEMYSPRESSWSRSKVNVLMRLDESKLPAKTGSQEPYASQSPVAAQAAGVVTAAQVAAAAAARQAAAAAAGGRGPAARGAVDTGLHADQDYAITWCKMYGNGRVFYSSLGHTKEQYQNPDVRKMYMEAIKWALKLEDGSTESHPKRN